MICIVRPFGICVVLKNKLFDCCVNCKNMTTVATKRVVKASRSQLAACHLRAKEDKRISQYITYMEALRLSLCANGDEGGRVGMGGEGWERKGREGTGRGGKEREGKEREGEGRKGRGRNGKETEREGKGKGREREGKGNGEGRKGKGKGREGKEREGSQPRQPRQPQKPTATSKSKSIRDAHSFIVVGRYACGAKES